MAKILLVDDDTRLCEMLRRWLLESAHVVDMAFDGDAASEYLKSSQYDAIVLDITMPGKTGLEVLQEYRAAGGIASVLMLTGNDTVEDVEKGLGTGADDYLRKPFHARELVMRLNALLRRPRSAEDEIITGEDLQLNCSRLEVLKNGALVNLLPKEIALLEFFMRNPNQTHGTESLIWHVWKGDADATEEAVLSCIKRLRQKLDDEDSPSYIRTVRGAGYIFSPNRSAI